MAERARTFPHLNVVSFLWLLFKLPDFRDVLEYFRCLFTNPSGVQPQGLFVIGMFSLPVIIYHLAAGWPQLKQRWTQRMGSVAACRAEGLFYAALLLTVIVNSGTPGDFIYFQF